MWCDVWCCTVLVLYCCCVVHVCLCLYACTHSANWSQGLKGPCSALLTTRHPLLSMHLTSHLTRWCVCVCLPVCSYVCVSVSVSLCLCFDLVSIDLSSSPRSLMHSFPLHAQAIQEYNSLLQANTQVSEYNTVFTPSSVAWLDCGVIADGSARHVCFGAGWVNS